MSHVLHLLQGIAHELHTPQRRVHVCTGTKSGRVQWGPALASFNKLPSGRWRAMVRKQGHTLSFTFRLKVEADQSGTGREDEGVADVCALEEMRAPQLLSEVVLDTDARAGAVSSPTFAPQVAKILHPLPLLTVDDVSAALVPAS